jgi:vesicle coat complex subunit
MGGVTPAAQSTSQSFASAEPQQKQLILRDMASGKVQASADEIENVVGQALRDEDVRVRQSGLGVIAAYAMADRLSNQAVLTQPLDASQYARLMPTIKARVRDSDPAVRHAAVLAMGNVDRYLNRDKAGKLSPDVWDTLFELYARESTEPKIRWRS